MNDRKKSAPGRVVQVIGPVIDVEFESDDLPEIYTALRLDYEPAGEEEGEAVHLTAEIQQHLGRNQVRAVLLGSRLRPSSTSRNEWFSLARKRPISSACLGSSSATRT